MRLRTPTGLADLALAYATLCPKPNELESIAQLLGLIAIDRVHLPPTVSPQAASLAEAPPATASIDMLAAASLVEEEDDDEEYSSVSISPTRLLIEESKIWGPISINKGFPKKHPVLAQPGEIPEATLPPAGIADSKAWPLLPKESRQYRSPTPLIPAGIRRSFLKDAASILGTSGDIDTLRLADNIARGKWQRTIPRIRRRSVERPPRFLVDVSQSMTPYLDEANDLVGMAKSILGCSASSITWTSGPPDLNHEDDTRPSPTLSPGDTLIVLSLLGLGASGIEQKAWLKFAQTASCRGVRLVAISPALPAHWGCSDARRYWSFIPWMCHGSCRRISSPDEVSQLAALLSVVANPDPAMVRDARVRLFPNTEPYLESMLIQSRWVAAAFRGRLVMQCDKSGCQHQLLLSSPQLLKQAQMLTASELVSNVPDCSPATSAEKLWADALCSDPDADKRVNAGLAGLIKALHENQYDESFARFAYSVLERLPLNKLNSELGRLAALMVHNGLRQQLDDRSLDLAAKHHSWLYPKSTVIGLAWNGRKLFLKDRPRSGDALIALPDMPRRHVRINWGKHLGVEWRCFLRGHRNVVNAPELPASVTTLSGQTYTLTQPDEDDIWRTIERSLKAGEIIKGRLTSMVMNRDGFVGFLIDIGITAFLPASQFAIDGFVEAPEGWLGQFVEVIVIEADRYVRHIVVSRTRALVLAAKGNVQSLSNLWDNFVTMYPIGSIINGTVKNITDFGAFIDINGLDGLLHVSDMSWGRHAHPNKILKIGQKLDVVLLDVNKKKKRVSLGLKQIIANPWNQIESKFPVGTKVKGKVVSLVPYGAFVLLETDVEGLVHVTELSWTNSKRRAKPSDLLKLDQEIEAVVLGINREEQKISLGIRHLISNPWDNAETKYPVGSKVKGKVRNFTDYGAFVELETDIDGMVHVSDMSWTRKINYPSEMLKLDDEIWAIVLDVDKVKQKIALGMKQLEIDPWASIEKLYKVGDLVQGKVTKLASFGAFVGLQHDIDGLVPFSQIRKEILEEIKNSLMNALKNGQEVNVCVVEIDRVERHIKLSMESK